ncbi:MAG: ATPase [Elusimicrobia bacterium CG08_land_8_20_14_0_20_59_10]|nr:MAG: ATPase [Elusimicrobia bacterium CG08_land_8_20_14_0_20_59_10]
MIKREFYKKLLDELISDGKMVFVSGPRQAGKTTAVREYAEKYSNLRYFNWDSYSDKKTLALDPYFFEKIDRKDATKPLVLFDEIHKYKRWKNYLKGVYDDFSKEYLFIVTGSGRLDISQKGGDALSGRYFQMNFFPLTVSELAGKKRGLGDFLSAPLENSAGGVNEAKDAWNTLSRCGGFPEPFLKGEEKFLLKWSESYARQIIRDDIRNLYDLKNVEMLEMLVAALPSRIGSPFSISGIASDFQVAFETIKNWLRILDAFYVLFTVSTWTKKVARSILKEKKLYLFNYTEITDAPVKFENMVALEIYKAVKFWNNAGYGRFGLHYLRNRDKEEVDFLIARDNEPILLIEAKYSDVNVSRNLMTFQNYFNVPAVQLVNVENVHRVIKNGKNQALIATAHVWLSALPLLEQGKK